MSEGGSEGGRWEVMDKARFGHLNLATFGKESLKIIP